MQARSTTSYRRTEGRAAPRRPSFSSHNREKLGVTDVVLLGLFFGFTDVVLFGVTDVVLLFFGLRFARRGACRLG